MEFRIIEHFSPSLTHLFLRHHPFAEAGGTEATLGSLLSPHTSFTLVSFILVSKLRAQVQTLVPVFLRLRESVSPSCHRHSGFPCFLLLGPVYSAVRSGSSHLKSKTALCEALAYCPSSVAPAQVCGAARPGLSDLVSFHSSLCFMFNLLASSYFLQEIPTFPFLQDLLRPIPFSWDTFFPSLPPRWLFPHPVPLPCPLWAASPVPCGPLILPSLLLSKADAHESSQVFALLPIYLQLLTLHRAGKTSAPFCFDITD